MVSCGNSIQPTSSFPEYEDSRCDEKPDEKLPLPPSGRIKISCTPILSTPVGLYHITVGLLCSVINICRMVGSFFVYQWKYGVGLYARPIPDGHTVSILGEENKKGLSESVDTIARGILETVPFIGNFAMYHSKWRYAPIFQDLYESRRQKCLRDVEEVMEGIELLKMSMAQNAMQELDACMKRRNH